MLENEGYPFKSKKHSLYVYRYQTKGMMESVRQYLGAGKWGSKYTCPKILKYQFTSDFKLRISDRCCLKMKEDPIDEWRKSNNKKYAIFGTMRAEGGRRENLQCLSFKGNKLFAFQPLAVVTKEWEDWYIQKNNVDICKIYYAPYNFKRTGCKGCPFALNLNTELNILQQYFPNERKQCEMIWGKVYEEYRRIGYRLPKYDGQMAMDFSGNEVKGAK